MAKEKIIKICDNIIETGWLLVIFLIPVIFSYWQATYNLFQLPKAVAFSMLVEIMLIAYVLKIFLENKIAVKVDYKIFILLSGLLISAFLSLYFSLHPLRSWQGEYIRQQGVYFLLHAVIFFALLILNIKDWQQVKRIIIIILFSSLAVCFYGLLQYFDLDFINWKKSAVVQGRIFSSLGQPNFLGHYLIMIIPVSIFSLFYIIKKNIARFLLIILIIMQLLCLILTYSRAGWLGFIVEISLFLFFILFYKKRITVKKIWAVIVLLIACYIFLFLINNYDNRLTKRIRSITYLKYSSGYTRILYWQGAMQEIKKMDIKRLLFGYGQENVSDIYVKYYQPKWAYYETINSYPDRSHNVILDIIFMNGLVGLFIIISLYYYIIILLLRFIKSKKDDDKTRWLAVTLLAALAGCFTNNLFSFSVIATSIYLYLILALMIFLASADKKEILIKFNFLKKYSKALLFLALIFIINVSIWLYNIKPIIADYYYMEVDRAKKIRGGHCLDILDNLNKTIKWAPNQTFYLDKYVYNNLNCLVDKNAQEVNLKIKNNILLAIDIADQQEIDFKFKINIAHAYGLFGFYFDPDYYKTADEKYKEILKINPYLTYVYKDWGRTKLWQGDFDKAIKLFNLGLKIMPDLSMSFSREHANEIKKEYIVFYKNLGEAYFYKKDYDNALYYYKKLLSFNPYQIDIYNKIANIYYLKGDINQAIWYNKRAKKFNNNPIL